jgi:hypothetical protein
MEAVDTASPDQYRVRRCSLSNWSRSRMSRVPSRTFARGPNLNQAIRPIQGVSTAPVGSGLILRAPGGHCVSLHERASRSWRLLERGASLRTIHRLMRQEYGVPPAWIDNELLLLLQALVRAGAIEQFA